MSEPLNWWIRSEMQIDDAKGLCRAGELAARALDEESDRDAFSSQFRAIEEKLKDIQACKEEAGAEVRELRASRKPKGAADV